MPNEVPFVDLKFDKQEFDAAHKRFVKEELERYERKALKAELNRWGRWLETHYMSKGYRTMDTIVAAMMGRGGGNAGHVILCLDMPTDIYATHGRVLRLPEHEQDAILIKFAVKLKPDGQLWTDRELCLTAGIDLESFQKRVNRALRRIQGLPVD